MAIVPAQIRDQSLTVIKLGANDKYAHDTGSTSTTKAKWSPKTTLTFTPPSTGDYLVLAFCLASTGSTARRTAVRLSGAAGNVGEVAMKFRSLNDIFPWGTIQKVNLTASSKTFQIQLKSPDLGAVFIATRSILAIRLDNHDNNYVNTVVGPTTNSSTTYQTEATETTTPAIASHLILGSMHLSTASGFIPQVKGRIGDGTDVFQEQIIKPVATNIHYPMFSCNLRPYPASSITWKTEFAKYSGLGSADVADSTIAIVDLFRAGSVNIKGASIKGANIL